MVSDKKKFLQTRLSAEVVQALVHYLGFRVMAAGALDLTKSSLFVSESSSGDMNLLFVCTMLHQLLHGFVFGAPMCQGVHVSYQNACAEQSTGLPEMCPRHADGCRYHKRRGDVESTKT